MTARLVDDLCRRYGIAPSVALAEDMSAPRRIAIVEAGTPDG